MAICRFCKSEIPEGASRCPHCTSHLTADEQSSENNKVTYIIDKSLVQYAKLFGLVLSIFLVIGVALYYLDIKKLREDMETTHHESQRLDVSIKEAQFTLKKQLSDMDETASKIKSDAESAAKSAELANAALSSTHDIERRAKESLPTIEGARAQAVVFMEGVSKVPQLPASSPTQMENFVDAIIVKVFKDILPDDRYIRLQTKLTTKTPSGLRRRIFDAKNSERLPGDLILSEGDPPASDETINEVFKNVEIIHSFYKDVFGREITDDAGGSIVVTVHYGQNYDNLFWNGRQIVAGDGDGTVFRKGAFTSLSAIAIPITHAVNAARSKLTFDGQSGALESSFADIVSTLVGQWLKKQRPEEASWLVNEGVFAEGIKGVALRSLKQPGTAYDNPRLGKDSQVATMQKYDKRAQDNGGVHTNSGIPSKAFYELSVRLKEYAWEKPAKIWYAAYGRLNSNATFQDLADTTLAAASETYGEQSPERLVVMDSWKVVGIIPK